MQIIRQSSFKASPWKNGGGITHEVIRFPATGDGFLWRVSVARIDVSGPFSDFAGYQRIMVLLRGSGLMLDFDAAAHCERLASVGDVARFDGARKTGCRLIDGSCMDLNLMTADAVAVTANVERISAPRALPAVDSTTLVFGITGALSIDDHREGAVALDPWDLAVLPAGDAATVSPGGGPSAAPALVFLATVDHNPP